MFHNRTVPALLAVLAVMASSLLAGSVANAAIRAEGDVTWSVEPLPDSSGVRRTFEYSVDPGTQIVDSVVVTNAGETPAEFLIYATDALNESGTGSFGLLRRDEEPTDVGSWIELAIDEVTLEPGTQATIPFNLLVPSDAGPGDHVAGIVASVVTTGENDDGAAVTLEQRVGARVYLEVSGVQEAGVEVGGVTSSFTPSLNPFAPGNLTITYDLRNTGNQRLDLATTLTVTGPFGIPLGEISADPLTEFLPRQSIRMSADLPAIAALALVFSEVRVTPAEVGSLVESDFAEPTPSETPTPTPTPSESVVSTSNAGPAVEDIVVTEGELSFEPVSQTAPALAISWTLLALVVVALGIVYLVWRYVSGTRERFYLAIDEATAAGKQQALAERAPGESL